MRDVLLGALAGVLVGSGVAAFSAWRAKAAYEAQGAALARTLQTQGQQVQATLTSSGEGFRTALTALARNEAEIVAANRALGMLRVYGLDSTTLAKLERYRDLIS